MAGNHEFIDLKAKKIGKISLIVFLGIILLAAVYGSLRRTAARFSRDFTSPFLQIINISEEKATELSQMAKPKRKLAAENAFLYRKNMVQEASIIALKQLEQENKTLRAILKLPKKAGYTPVTADICGRTAPLWRERFVINRGWSDGIRKGDAVAAPDKLGNLVMAGQIIEVSAGTAVAATVFSGDCKLSVVLATDGSAGGMERTPSDPQTVVRYLPIDGDYRDGALILTSGLSEGTPGGIPVAKVLSRGKDRSPALIRDQLYAELNVQPLIRIDSLRTVVVFAKESGSSRK